MSDDRPWRDIARKSGYLHTTHRLESKYYRLCLGRSKLSKLLFEKHDFIELPDSILKHDYTDSPMGVKTLRAFEDYREEEEDGSGMTELKRFLDVD